MNLNGILNNKNKSLLFNILLILLALIISFNIFNAQSKKIKILKEKKESEERKNSVLEGISGLEKRMDSYKKLLSKKDEGNIINSISNIAKESGVNIVSIRPMPEEPSAEYIRVPFALVISSPDYHTLGRFISNIENYENVYMVDFFEIVSQEEDKQLTANLTIDSIVAGE